MRFEHQAQSAPLAIEGGQELSSAIGGLQHTVHEPVERVLLADVVRARHTRFQIPPGTVVVAQTGATGPRRILRAGWTECDITQQLRTRNEGHRLVFP
ncbi:MAG TPA: hypothetical protein VGM82_03970 [Gemmatimonadaceae bacterium]